VARKVSMYSGDIRRSLQIAKRSVELCRDKHFESEPPKGTPETKVTYKDVIDAFDELFNSKTVKVLQSLQKIERILILALHDQLSRFKSEKVLIDDLQARCQAILRDIGWQAKFQTHIFREIVKRLQAFGLVSMQIEHNKISDNVHLQLSVYKDDIVNGFSSDNASCKDIEKIMEASVPIKELFKETIDAKNMKYDQEDEEMN